MLLMIFMSYLILMFSLMLMMLASYISKKTFSDREKTSPFECGFDPKSSSRLPFSLQFFLIAIIFLIFDVEITLLVPLVLIIKLSNFFTFFFMSNTFFLLLIMGTYHEWMQGALNWT